MNRIRVTLLAVVGLVSLSGCVPPPTVHGDFTLGQSWKSERHTYFLQSPQFTSTEARKGVRFKATDLPVAIDPLSKDAVSWTWSGLDSDQKLLNKGLLSIAVARLPDGKPLGRILHGYRHGNDFSRVVRQRPPILVKDFSVTVKVQEPFPANRDFSIHYLVKVPER